MILVSSFGILQMGLKLFWYILLLPLLDRTKNFELFVIEKLKNTFDIS